MLGGAGYHVTILACDRDGTHPEHERLARSAGGGQPADGAPVRLRPVWKIVSRSEVQNRLRSLGYIE